MIEISLKNDYEHDYDALSMLSNILAWLMTEMSSNRINISGYMVLNSNNEHYIEAKNEEENPNDDLVESRITGETFIKPLIEYKYIYHGLGGNRWQIDTKKYPVQFSVNPEDDREIILKWTQSFSGQFEISCAGVTKTIVVESLF